MSTAFNTTITLIDIDNIGNLVKEIGIRYKKLVEVGCDAESMETVENLFYGESKDSSHLSYQGIRAK